MFTKVEKLYSIFFVHSNVFDGNFNNTRIEVLLRGVLGVLTFVTIESWKSNSIKLSFVFVLDKYLP